MGGSEGSLMKRLQGLLPNGYFYASPSPNEASVPQYSLPEGLSIVSLPAFCSLYAVRSMLFLISPGTLVMYARLKEEPEKRGSLKRKWPCESASILRKQRPPRSRGGRRMYCTID